MPNKLKISGRDLQVLIIGWRHSEPPISWDEIVKRLLVSLVDNETSASEIVATEKRREEYRARGLGHFNAGTRGLQEVIADRGRGNK